ncbi:MAG: YbaN family protein [Acidimicrobiales bacterium]
MTGPIVGSGVRVLWILAGLLLVAIGGVGIVVPGLPTTGFMVAAAWCFSRSSPRLERWLLGLPAVGPLVTDYRAGLGMPRRAKIIASTCITLAVGVSAGLVIGPLAVRILVAALGAVGVWYVTMRVPTRERVLADRARRTVAPQPSSPTVVDRPH